MVRMYENVIQVEASRSRILTEKIPFKIMKWNSLSDSWNVEASSKHAQLKEFEDERIIPSVNHLARLSL